jgi:octaheme c-type cytochrome (tetrathionate reductase family)
MKLDRYQWVFGLGATIVLVAVPLAVFLPRAAPPVDDPARYVPVRQPHTDHTPLLTGPYATGPEVTRACLECHPDAAQEMMQTVHWTWESKPYQLPDRSQPVTIGKKNQLNNFCIGIQSNWEGCTTCHAGYGWEDADFDFSQADNVDCLVCHDTTGTYVKGTAGLPVEGVDLAYVAGNVGYSSRRSCGTCHFEGGGGEGVKHGDLDGSLIRPSGSVDVHMGSQEMVCTDCHRTQGHLIAGRAISVSLDQENQVECTNCHAAQPHGDDRINAHTSAVACQTCHIPAAALKEPTKMFWDWSTAGQDLPENHYTYLKIKGSFIYESDFIPEYRWYNGLADRHPGDAIDRVRRCSIRVDRSKTPSTIFPFKIHTAKQPTTSSTAICFSRRRQARRVLKTLTGISPSASARWRPASRTAANMGSLKPRCTGLSRTWWRRRIRRWSAPTATPRKDASTGKPWGIRATRSSGAAGPPWVRSSGW